MTRPQRRRARRNPAPKAKRAAPQPQAAQHQASQCYEVETLPGLEEIARREIRQRLGKGARFGGEASGGRIPLRYAGGIRDFDSLATAIAVHQVLDFAIPRPKALLGQQNLTRLIAACRAVIAAHPPGRFGAFRIGAAGSRSAVYQRLRREIGVATALDANEDAAHLQIAVRRAPEGWQALIRTTPMPLSARAWRVCDMPGALNAAIAAAMVSLMPSRPTDRILNLFCGSGTLMIERLLFAPAASVTGVDISGDALICAHANLRAARRRASLIRADCSALPLPDASADAIMADLPYGMLQGGDIAALYRAALAEAGRVAAPGASLALITTRERALLAALADARVWTPRRSLSVSVPYRSGYITPRIYALRRSGRG